MRPTIALFAAVLGTARIASAQSPPEKLSAAGDSISQGAAADGFESLTNLFSTCSAFDLSTCSLDEPWNSWVQGTNPPGNVDSIFVRYQALNPSMQEEAVSKDGAKMVNDFVGQANAICNQATTSTTGIPNRVYVLLGQNDVCDARPSVTNDAAANMPTVEVFVAALDAGLSTLARPGCLPPGSIVQVVSVIRVDFLYRAGYAKDPVYCPFVWQLFNICRIVTGESSSARRREIGKRIDQWNEALAGEVAAYDSNANGNNPNGIRFVTDWQGPLPKYKDTSAGTYEIQAQDIDGLDCFHPSLLGQNELACAEWYYSPDSSGASTPPPACFGDPRGR